MKLLFDQNLSRKLPTALVDLFPGSTHVIEVGLEHSQDFPIWEYAKEHVFVIVTADFDFVLLSQQYGFPPKVIYLASCNYPTRIAAELLRRNSILVRTFEQKDLGVLTLRHQY